jgi:elongation factor P
VKVDVAVVENREMQYLYKEGSDYIFMDTETYDQMHVSGETVGDMRDYLLENMTANVIIHAGTPLYIELPASVDLTISETEPGVQGDRSTGGTKPARLETGATVQVPLFIITGERIRVDTRTGEYLSRSN